MSTQASRASFVSSAGILLMLAVGAFAAIYYGAVPWALGRAIGATLWMLGWR